MSLRSLAALAAGTVASAIGALLLGEYEFSGMMPYAAGVLFGLVVAELVAEIGRVRTLVVAVSTGAVVAAGLFWAARISTGGGLRPLPGAVWPSMALGVGAVFLRVGPRPPRPDPDG